MTELENGLSRSSSLTRDAISSVQARAADAADWVRQGASALTAAARERTQRRLDDRRSYAAQRLDDLADAIRPDGERRGGLGLGVGTTALVAAGAMGLGLAIGYALHAQRKARNRRVGTYFTQKAHPSGHSEFGTTEEDYLAAGAGFEDLSGGETLADRRIDPADGQAVEALERMEPDYRERARAGSDL